MKISNIRHGSAEKMLSAFQNRIDELEYGSSIESATNFDSLKTKVLDKLSKEGYNAEDTSTIDYADGVADLLMHSSDPDINEWYNNTKRNYPDDLKNLPKKITSANEIDDADYLEELCIGVTAILDGNGYDAVAELEGDYIVIQSLYDPATSRYVQPIDEIEPNWDDIDDDTEQLADAYMQEFPNPDYE